MINEVYQTVLALLNKNNYGYMTPQEFNLFAEQAQLDVFEDMFYNYNMQINKENVRKSGTGYANIRKGIEEEIDIFSSTQTLSFFNPALANGTPIKNQFVLPSDYFLINRVYGYSNIVTQAGPTFSTTTAGTEYTLTDGGANFLVPDPVTGRLPKRGDVVLNVTNPLTSPLPFAFILDVRSANIIEVDRAIFPNPFVAQDYLILDGNSLKELDKVSQRKVDQLNMSNLTKPSVDFPVYTTQGQSQNLEAQANTLQVYPIFYGTWGVPGINPVPEFYTGGGLMIPFVQYIRYPRRPNWTFSMVGGDPQFNAGAADFQDFELPQDNYNDLVSRILQFGGLTIRETLPIEYGKNSEITETNEEISK
tara:strand:- start:34316 stop:35404 length:1089 start_codon:yes stop_codon:yes gene_type:complete